MVWAECSYLLKNGDVLVPKSYLSNQSKSQFKFVWLPELSALTFWCRAGTSGLLTPSCATDVSQFLCSWLGDRPLPQLTGIYWAALGTTREHPAAAFHCENEKEKNFIEKKLKLPFSEKDPILNGKVVNVSISVLNLLGLFQAVFALGSGLKVSWEAFWPPLYLINAIYAFKHRILIFHYGKT